MQKTITFLIAILTVLLHVQKCSASISFIESGAAWGLAKPLKGIMAHAAACGDIDNDGDLDLYVGNFCDRPPDAYFGRSGPIPYVLLINKGTRFRESDQSPLRFEARTSGAVFVDLDNDGDLDLYVSNNSKAKGLRVANKLFENIESRFQEIFGDNDACVIMGGRSVDVFDYDGDGLLDLLVAEDKWTGRRTWLLRNSGRLHFDDASTQAGLPTELPGLGVITPDLYEDGRLDIFMANWFPQKSSKLYLNREHSDHWLRVKIVGRTVNRMGIGTKVKVYPAGELGNADKLIGFEEIGTGFGFCSGQEAVAHFGLGELSSCDVEIILPQHKGVIHRTHQRADRLLIEYEPVELNMETATRIR